MITKMDPKVVSLVDLQPDEVTALATAGCTACEDLAVLEHVDLQKALKTSSVVKDRSLSKIAWYLAAGGTITDQTTMQDILQFQHRAKFGNQGTSSQSQNMNTVADVMRGAPKLSVNELSGFSGDALEFEEWELETKATVGQTVYMKLLENPPAANNIAMVARDVELFNMFVASFLKGSALHVINEIDPPSGYKAWEAIQKWYGNDATSRTIIDHYRNKLQNLQLDEDTTASEYVNEFIICCQKLEARNEGMTDATKRAELLGKIINDDYDFMKQQLIGDTSKDFKDCITRIRSREQELIAFEAKEGLAKKVRRNKFSNGSGGGGGHDTSGSLIPEFPRKIMKATHRHFNTVLKNDLKRWRSVWNKEKRLVAENELKFNPKKASSKKDEEEDEQSVAKAKVEGISFYAGPQLRRSMSKIL